MLWQVPVCALIAVLPAAAAVAVIYRTGKQPPRVFDLWAPSWRIINPYWLLGYRGLVFLVMTWLLAQIVLIDGAFAFYFYTQWTFTLVIIYFVIGAVISAHGCWAYSRTHISESEAANGFLKSELVNSNAPTMTVRGNADGESTRLPNRFEGKLLEKRAGFWGYVMQIIYQISAGAVILTDVVFWLLLVPTMSEHLRLDFVMICMHSLNAVFLLIDTAVNRLPFPWFGMAYFVLWSCSYLTFQWVLHAFGLLNWWPYPFMDLSTPWAPLWYLAIALVHIPCYGIYYLTTKAKNSFFSKLFPNLYIQSY